MPIMEEFPLDFWILRDVSSHQVLGEMVNEIRQPIDAIIGYSELLLRADLPEQQRADIKIILEQAKYLKMILEAGLEYFLRTMDENTISKG